MSLKREVRHSSPREVEPESVLLVRAYFVVTYDMLDVQGIVALLYRSHPQSEVCLLL